MRQVGWTALPLAMRRKGEWQSLEAKPAQLHCWGAEQVEPSAISLFLQSNSP